MDNPFCKKEFPNVHDGHNYALDIIDGKIPANIWIIAACKRYVNDLRRIEEDEDCPFYFLPEKAEKFLKRVQNFKHAVGHWDNPKIIYEPWQKFAWMNIKGFHAHYSKEVRFRSIHLDVARGNAKSTMASQCTLVDLCCDRPNGNRIYCAATSRTQAGEVLEGAMIMARKNKSYLRKYNVDVMANDILHRASNSFVKSISAEANNADGKIGKLVVTDELHAMQRKLYETLVSGQSKRRDSQIISITTAGYKNDGIGASQRAYAKKVALGEVDDDTFFSLVFCIDDDDDPFAGPEVWIKANPNFGVSVDPVNFEAQAKKAMVNPEDKNGFMIKHLNLYMDSLNQFYEPNKWAALFDEDLKIEQFHGEKCYLAIDIATTTDLCSACLVFYKNGKYYPFWRSFVPEDVTKEVKKQMYKKFIEEGDLETMNGEVIDLQKFYDIILEWVKPFKVEAVHCDPWNASEMMIKFRKDGYEVIDFRMNTGNFSEPMKKIQTAIKLKEVAHNTKGLLYWTLGNVVARYDAADNVYPRKEHEDLKIDTIVAFIMAIAGWINEEEEEELAWEERGLISF